MKSIRDFEVKGKRVLVRCDFNVSLDEQGLIRDDFRITQTLPTLEMLRSAGAKIVLLSHLGSPKGKAVPDLSLSKVYLKLQKYLSSHIISASDCIGKDIEDATHELTEGDILLLENVRFHAEEEANVQDFAQKLSLLGDIFINDAFSVCHRAHASVLSIPNFLPSGAGLLLEKEVNSLGHFCQDIKRPFVAIVGGKKVEDKLSFIDRVSDIADEILLGNLVFEEAQRKKIVFQNPEKIIAPLDGFPSNDRALDIGPHTVELFVSKIMQAQSVFWTGPLGLFEQAEYAQGSLAIANALIESKAFTGAGGGDLSAFLGQYGLREKFSYVSTGGGAALAFLAGEELPGLKALGYYG